MTSGYLAVSVPDEQPNVVSAASALHWRRVVMRCLVFAIVRLRAARTAGAQS